MGGGERGRGGRVRRGEGRGDCGEGRSVEKAERGKRGEKERGGEGKRES